MVARAAKPDVVAFVCRDGPDSLPIHDYAAAPEHSHSDVQPLPAQVLIPTLHA